MDEDNKFPLSTRSPDESVVDTVNSKTFPRGVEISYSHVVFDKKYKIYPETKRIVFLKWKWRLVFDGSKKKSCEVTFSPTPSLPPMIRFIRTLPAEWCTPDWERVTKTLTMLSVFHHWKEVRQRMEMS